MGFCAKAPGSFSACQRNILWQKRMGRKKGNWRRSQGRSYASVFSHVIYELVPWVRLLGLWEQLIGCNLQSETLEVGQSAYSHADWFMWVKTLGWTCIIILNLLNLTIFWNLSSLCRTKNIIPFLKYYPNNITVCIHSLNWDLIETAWKPNCVYGYFPNVLDSLIPRFYSGLTWSFPQT